MDYVSILKERLTFRDETGNSGPVSGYANIVLWGIK